MIAEIDITQSQPRLLRSYEWGLDVSETLEGAGGVGGLVVEWCYRVSGGTTSCEGYAPCYDGNGNVMELVSLSCGEAVGRYEYGAFGETISVEGDWVAQENPVRFSTKYGDAETGLVYDTHRYYEAATGRWLSRDPIEEKGGFNLYGMVGNDPVNRWDLLGLDFIAIGDRGVKGTLGALNHYSVSYWESDCDPPDKEIAVADITKLVRGAKKKASAELLVDNRFRVNHTPVAHNAIQGFFQDLLAPFPPVNIPISVIYLSDSATTIKPIYSGRDTAGGTATVGNKLAVLQKWDQIDRAARSYPYGEQDGFGTTFQNWPNSLYEIMDSGNNSNTFVRWVVQQAGLKMNEMSGLHPGAMSPHQINAAAQGYIGTPFLR